MLHGPGERHNCDRHARTPTKNLEAGYQITVIRHLLGQSPNEWEHQHAVQSSRQWQASQEVRRRGCPVYEPACRIGATEYEYEGNRDERKAHQRIADESCPLEADKIEQADALAAREPPQQRQASGVDQCPVHRQPGLSVMPRSRRRSQEDEDGRDNGLRSHPKRCARKQHQCRAAPLQRSRLPPSKQGLVAIRVYEWNSSFLGEESHLLASSVDDASDVIWFGFLLQITWLR